MACIRSLDNAYPLGMDICLLSFRVHKISINTRLVNPIEFALVTEEIGFPQRPCLGH